MKVRRIATAGCLSGVLLILSACSDSGPESVSLQAEIAQLRKEGDEMTQSVIAIQTRNRESYNLIRDIEREQDRESQMRLEFEEINDYANDLRAADSYVDSRLQAWRTAASQYLVGSELGDVRLNSGNILRSTVVLALDEETVTVQHADGEDKLGYREFPEAIRLKLFHEPTIIVTTKLSKP